MSVPTTPPVAVEAIDFDKRVEQFVKLRDKIKEIKDRHTEELAPYNAARETLEAIMLDHLNKVGGDGVRTAHGTVSRGHKDSASIADMNAFWTWVITQGNWDFVDRKANTTAVRDYINDLTEKAKTDPTVIPAAPPGINFSSVQTVGVRRGSKK